jgi:plastocyanin
MKFTCSTILGCFVIALVGCDGAAPPIDVPRVPVASVQGQGHVSGKVHFGGTPPRVRMLRNEPCCPGAPGEIPDESVVVNPNGTLANTFVFLEGGPRTDGSALPKKTLDQVFCRYVPHVVGIVVGQPLHVKSSDRTMHNVHYSPRYSAAQNFWMNAPGDGVDTTFKAAEFVKSGCDIHPWMSATIGVFDNPFFAITADDGTFDITGVPAGEYTLVANHERYGRLEQKIRVEGSAPVIHDFTYAPPQ